jgi:pimeloyl-ACP methyl ester carboxylesterase
VPRPVNHGTPADHQLKYAIRLIPVDEQVSLEAWQIPAKAPRGTIALFHGYAGSKSDLLPEAAAFHKLGFDVWLVDFRGSGGSTEDYTTIGYLEAEDVAAVARDMQTESAASPLILYGRSMGAAAVLRAMHACGTRADAVILESTFDRMLTTAQNRFHQMGLPAFPSANLLVYWGGVSAGFDASRHNPVDYAPSCECPTLLLHGESDVNAQPDEGRHVQSRLGDTSAELVIFPEAGHTPLRATDAERWQAAIERLLKRLPR